MREEIIAARRMFERHGWPVIDVTRAFGGGDGGGGDQPAERSQAPRGRRGRRRIGLMLVLASTSPTRRRVLDGAGVAHRAIAPGVDEETAKLSLRAEGLSSRSQAGRARPNSRRGPGGQGPASRRWAAIRPWNSRARPSTRRRTSAHSREQLERLRGKTHALHSALVLVEGGMPTWREVVSTTLTMRPFSGRLPRRLSCRRGRGAAGLGWRGT